MMAVFRSKIEQLVRPLRGVTLWGWAFCLFALALATTPLARAYYYYPTNSDSHVARAAAVGLDVKAVLYGNPVAEMDDDGIATGKYTYIYNITLHNTGETTLAYQLHLDFTPQDGSTDVSVPTGTYSVRRKENGKFEDNKAGKTETEVSVTESDELLVTFYENTPECSGKGELAPGTTEGAGFAHIQLTISGVEKPADGSSLPSFRVKATATQID